MMTRGGHTLTTTQDLPTMTLTASCSCGNWTESAYVGGYHAPIDVVSAWEAHLAEAAGIPPELMPGATPPARVSPPQFPPAPNPAMDAIISAALAMAKAGAGAAKALEEFTDAHSAARRNGVGVLVVRRPDGTITSTPNVYLAPGVVLYTDDPGSPWQTTPAPFVDAAAPFVARAPFETEWAPRYTAAPPLNLPNAA